MIRRFLISLLCVSLLLAARAAEPLQTFTVKDYLGHRWVDELVHFAIDVPGTGKDYTLTDEKGEAYPVQLTDVVRQNRRTKATLWTVVTVEPGVTLTLKLQTGKPSTEGTVAVKQAQGFIALSNDRMEIALPLWPGTPEQPVDLTTLPAPLRAIRQPGDAWLCDVKWVNAGPVLQVKEATTKILEAGPVRATVEQKLTFTDGHTYRAVFTLGAKQDAVLVTEDTDVDAPKAAIRLSMLSGLKADHIYWHNQWKETTHAKSWSLTDTTVSFEKEDVICKLRPWSYWWLGDITEWAGFYQGGNDTFAGVLALRPSRWSPTGWDGFDRTEIPVTARPGGQIDLTFALLATTRKPKDAQEQLIPLHREWAITAGTVTDHVPPDGKTFPLLRRQLSKYSEFPLDEVKDYGFDFKAADAKKGHTALFCTKDDLERIREQVKKDPKLKAQVDADVQYILNACWSERTLTNEGWQAYYTKNYIANGQAEKLPEAYIGSDNPVFGKLMAAAVKGLSKSVIDTFLEQPARPAIGAYGPWYTENIMRLLRTYDLIAGKEIMTPEEEATVRAVLVFSAHILAHPDYWNTDRGLCSANPNMTSSILLPRGLVALQLAGHPKSKMWLQGAEDEFTSELKDWIAPGGAWVEDPGYQSASLDGMFMLAQGIKNVLGQDYFADPQFKATMDYYGFLLTPPDRRFPPTRKPEDTSTPPMVLPSIGDMFSGYMTCYNGWMAGATAKTDPAYSARQQFYWKGQNSYLGMAGRAAGITLAMTNAELPAIAPAELSRSFPGFGSVLRTSWTDPKASYIAHRTGPFVHHYHNDFNEIVYYAKGAPLCTDFGNCYQPVQRGESWYHNRVSFEKGDSPKKWGSTGEIIDVRSLPNSVDYSYGKSSGSGGQQDHRHILLVKSANPLGANYTVIRDTTVDGQANQQFYWNLWCLSKDPQINGEIVHFPGQFDVDLDVHVLSPVNPQIEKDHWNWTQQIYVWSHFAEEQYGMRVAKPGSKEDFLCVLYPRAQGQEAAQISTTGGDAVLEVNHMEGSDYILLSPMKPVEIATGELLLKGEIAFVRKYKNNTLRLAVVKGAEGKAGLGDWSVSSDGPVALEITGKTLTGESTGPAHTAVITLPAGLGDAMVKLDGIVVKAEQDKRTLTIVLPEGEHSFEVKW
ncbi:MAG: hypothetical protein ACYDBB_12440 [Armatimonadota bacterium]